MQQEMAPIGNALELPPPAESGLFDGVLGALGMGGPVVMILVFMSVVALAIVLVKLWQFSRLQLSRRDASSEILALYRQGAADEAVRQGEQQAHPASRLAALAIRGSRNEGLPVSAVREEVARVGAGYLAALRSYLRPLEVIAALAPLLGLFGTVLGMIKAFQALQDAGSRVDPSVLAGGIWEALLTTAVGLAVAMPVVAVLNWLESRIERAARDMEDSVTRVFTVGLTP